MELTKPAFLFETGKIRFKLVETSVQNEGGQVPQISTLINAKVKHGLSGKDNTSHYRFTYKLAA